MFFPKDSPVVIEIGSTLLVCGGTEPLCSQAGLFTGGRVGRSADTFVGCVSAEPVFPVCSPKFLEEF